jgi:hypothetical protein
MTIEEVEDEGEEQLTIHTLESHTLSSAQQAKCSEDQCKWR